MEGTDAEGNGTGKPSEVRGYEKKNRLETLRKNAGIDFYLECRTKEQILYTIFGS